MSKKSKKQSRKTSGGKAYAPRSNSVASMKTSPADMGAKGYNNGVKSGSSKPYDAEFNPDYSQTVKDLRRIGVLASSFFLVLIVLSFFLR